jgi:hypothetical protein
MKNIQALPNTIYDSYFERKKQQTSPLATELYKGFIN